MILDEKGKLREAHRQLLDAMERHIYAHWSILASGAGIYFSAREAAWRLFEELLDWDAIDLIGVSQAIESGLVKKRQNTRARELAKARTLAKRKETVVPSEHERTDKGPP